MPKRPAEANLERRHFLKQVLKRLEDIPDTEECLHKAVLLRTTFIKVKALPKEMHHEAKRQRLSTLPG